MGDAAKHLRWAPFEIQRIVMNSGTLRHSRNPSSALMRRISDLRKQAGCPLLPMKMGGAPQMQYKQVPPTQHLHGSIAAGPVSFAANAGPPGFNATSARSPPAPSAPVRSLLAAASAKARENARID